jgi:hypothetical protein
MKKLCTVTALILINAVLLSLTVECLLNLFSFSMAISIDTAPEAPTSLPLILALTAVALLLLVGAFLARLKLSDRFRFTEKSLYLQYALAFLLSVPLIKLWEMLFDLLKITC